MPENRSGSVFRGGASQFTAALSVISHYIYVRIFEEVLIVATSEFSQMVIKLIQQIPAGKVATYGQIAKLAGKPQGSRGVAWILNSCSKSHRLPWQRVLNSQGKISFPVGSAEFAQQMRLLKKEGIVFNENQKIDLSKFQWQKTMPAKKVSKADSKKPRLFS